MCERKLLCNPEKGFSRWAVPRAPLGAGALLAALNKHGNVYPSPPRKARLPFLGFVYICLTFVEKLSVTRRLGREPWETQCIEFHQCRLCATSAKLLS